MLSIEEIKEIITLCEKTLASPAIDPNSGFLTRVPNEQELLRHSANSNCVVSRHQGKISGYLSFFRSADHDPIIEETIAKFGVIEWKGSPPAVDNLIYLDQIVIDSSLRKQGVGTELMQRVLEKYPTASFLAAIIEEPFFNHASVALVSKFGFKRVGERCLDEYRGLKPFKSGWYYRPSTST